MKQRPILFSTPMVRALLDGSKTQTRRVVKAKHLPWLESIVSNFLDGKWDQRPLPYGKPGDRLYVREGFRVARGYDKLSPIALISLIGAGEIGIHYESNGTAPATAGKLRPGIHMPRLFSRITLEIVSVRVERLQDISEADADAECFGGDFPSNVLPELFPGNADDWGHLSMAQCYQRLWESINGPESWSTNPWVWVVEFKRITGGNTP